MPHESEASPLVHFWVLVLGPVDAPGMCKMLRMPLSIPVSFNAVTDSLCFFPHFTVPWFYFPCPTTTTTTCPTKCRQYFSNFRFLEKAKVQRRFALFRSCPVTEHWTRLRPQVFRNSWSRFRSRHEIFKAWVSSTHLLALPIIKYILYNK